MTGSTCCELSDTAIENYDPIIPDPDVYNDELDGGVMYPVYEFFYEKNNSLVTIGIEPLRGKRLVVVDRRSDIDNKCEKSCPITSTGTLRRIKLSSVKQFNVPK